MSWFRTEAQYPRMIKRYHTPLPLSILIWTLQPDFNKFLTKLCFNYICLHTTRHFSPKTKQFKTIVFNTLNFIASPIFAAPKTQIMCLRIFIFNNISIGYLSYKWEWNRYKRYNENGYGYQPQNLFPMTQIFNFIG